MENPPFSRRVFYNTKIANIKELARDNHFFFSLVLMIAIATATHFSRLTANVITMACMSTRRTCGATGNVLTPVW